jgi:ribosomal protein S8
MMAELAKCDFINRIIFVNPTVSVFRLLLTKNNNYDSFSKINSKLIAPKISSKIFVYTPKSIIPHRRYFALIKKFETRMVAKRSLKIIKQLNADKPYILLMNNPNVFLHDLIDDLLKNTKLSIFDFSDDFLELGSSKKSIELFRRNIEKYTPAADIVITANEHIRLKYRSLNPNIYVIRNATNYSNFDRKDYKTIDYLEKLKSRKSPIIGYSGIANMSRLDASILDFVIKQRPDWKFVFIGFAKKEFLLKYSQNKNVYHISPVDYSSLPDYLQYFDVAIVPFKKNEHTKGNDLLKFHDFLAMGKAVVSTKTGGASDLKNVIRIARGSSEFLEFLEEIEKALCNETPEDVLRRKKTAFKNSWYNRISEFEHLLKDHLEI